MLSSTPSLTAFGRTEHDIHGSGRTYPQKKTTSVGELFSFVFENISGSRTSVTEAKEVLLLYNTSCILEEDEKSQTQISIAKSFHIARLEFTVRASHLHIL